MGRGLGLSVLPALVAFGCWFLPLRMALVGLIVTFVGLLIHDIRSARAGLAPGWYPSLRIQLTGAVVLCLVTAALFGGH